ncbi:MAG: hypothetical protein M1114_03850 [Candidatus Dependentiae bacterium]|nr:hypothetical protein [Candidatus Dependentiae bacterium]
MIYLCGIVFCFVCCLSAMDSEELVPTSWEERAEDLEINDQIQFGCEERIREIKNLCRNVPLQHIIIIEKKLETNDVDYQDYSYRLDIGNNVEIVYKNSKYDKKSFLRKGNQIITYNDPRFVFLLYRFSHQNKKLAQLKRAAERKNILYTTYFCDFKSFSLSEMDLK